MKLDPLGSPSRVAITKVVRATYRLEWEFDGFDVFHDGGVDGGYPDIEPARKRRVRTFFSRPAAYRAAAMRLVFARRDKLATGREGLRATGCRRCDATTPSYQDGAAFCKYHGGDGFIELIERLAARLMWRDRRTSDAP